MKTTSELNSKWWYRLVKVAFLGFCLLCLLISVFIIVDDNKPREVSDYKVECVADYTNHKTFYANKDKGIYIYQFGNDTVYQSLSDTAREELRDACDITKEEGDSSNKVAFDYIMAQEKLGTNSSVIQQYINDNLRPYVISKASVVEGGYGSVFLYSVLAILAVLISAEIIRRIFYYIILGNLRPKK